jgi:hypothetical protein
MTQLTDRQIEAQIDRALLRTRVCETPRQAEIDATEPRANRVLFDDGRIKYLCKINLTFGEGRQKALVQEAKENLIK